MTTPDAPAPTPRPPGRPRVLGVLGGLGPLASARFLETVYRRNLRSREQDMPVVLLLSDPTVTDRSRAVLRGEEEALARQVGERLERLLDAGADALLVACLTAHAVFDRLPPAVAARTRSLVDLIVDEQHRQPRRRLLLSTTGAVGAGVFQRHSRWSEVEASVVRLEAADQERLHEEIYRVKRGGPVAALGAWVDDARGRYDAEGAIFACTELHLLHAVEGEPDPTCIDPLLLAADLAATWCAAGAESPSTPRDGSQPTSKALR